MKKKLSVSIGIPAFNEGANIHKVLQALLAQREENFVLKEIILISDGSTDDTVKKAKALKDPRIIVYNERKRIGKSSRMNTLCQVFRGDVLFFMDADIVIKDDHMLTNIMKQANFKKAGLVGINARPLPPRTFVEHVLEAGVFIMKELSKDWNKGNNYLAFKGCMLGLERSLAKSLTIPADLVNNDAFLYFAAVAKGYTPAYLLDIAVYYRSPKTLRDHNKQASRFQHSHQEMVQYFGAIAQEGYKIPLALRFKSSLNCFLRQPVYFLAYLGVRFMTFLKREKNQQSAWNIAVSTK